MPPAPHRSEQPPSSASPIAPGSGLRNPRLSRRSLGLGALAAPAALGLASCGDDGGSGDPNSIRVVDYYSTPADDEAITQTLSKEAEKLGLTVTREVVPGDQLIAKVLQMGSSRTLPDILMLDNPDLQQVAASGALADLSQYGIDVEGFTPAVADLGMLDGTLYGVAPTVNTIALFYNVALLESAGVQPPTTWDELKEAAGVLTGDGVYGLAFSAIASYEGTWQFLPFMWSNGGEETDLATEKVAGASAFWQELVSEGLASRSVINWGQGDAMDQFTAGNAAMVVNGPWNIAGLEENAPDLEYGVVTIPVPTAGDPSIAPLGGEVWTVPVTGDEAKQAKAAELLKAFLQPENQLFMGDLRNTIPGNAAAAETFAADHVDLQTFVTQVSTARSRTAELGPDWPVTAKAIYTANQQVLVDGRDPLAAFDEAARSIR